MKQVKNVVDTNKRLKRCTSPLQLIELVICVFDYSDNDSLDTLVRVCRLFRSAIMSQAMLEIRLWKGRYFKLSMKYDELKKSHEDYSLLEEDEFVASTLDIVIPSTLQLQSNVMSVPNAPIPLKRVTAIEDMPGLIASRKQKRIERYKEIQAQYNNEDGKLPSNMHYARTIPEKEIYMRMNDDNTSAFKVATNVIDYSLYSIKQRIKAKRSDEFLGQIFIERLEKYDKKIYGVARYRLIDRPISKYFLILF